MVNTVTLSDGTAWPPINALKEHLEKLAKLQRRLKHKTRFSRNWKKLRAKSARLHKRSADRRRDHLCKIASDVCKNHAVVYREDLKIVNMSASASGTREEPGVHIAQKRGLNRAILDQGWGMLFRMIEAKQQELGGEVYAVPPHYTSHTCPECGCTDAGNRPKQAVFKCVNCGFAGHADLCCRNEQTRARAAPQSLWGAEEDSFSSSESAHVVQQQEPVEATDRKVSAVENPPA